MKKIIFFCVVLLIFSGNTWAASDISKNKIAVLDFQTQGKTTETDGLNKIVSEWFITALVKDGRYEIIERTLIDKILEEQRLTVSGHVDTANAARIGKILGAELLVTGSILQFQNLLELNARIIEVESGSIITAESLRNNDPASLEKDVKTIASLLISDIPLQGYVVKRSGNTIILDLGKNSGVKQGMQFQIFEKGSAISHPVTKEILDIEIIKKGIVEIQNIKEKISEAVLVSETAPSVIQAGQFAKNIPSATSTQKKQLHGQWESYKQGRTSSSISVSSKQKTIWEYSVPQPDEDSDPYSGVDLILSDTYTSFQNKAVEITLTSHLGKPVYFRLYSFVPGFSKLDDDDSLVPVETILRLKSGTQKIIINPADMQIPVWWREEYKQPTIVFHPETIQVLEFEALVDEDLGAVSDKLVFEEIFLLSDQ